MLGLQLLDRNAKAADAFDADRRGFLKHGLFMTAALGFWTPSLAEAKGAMHARSLVLRNVHTGESFRGEYWYGGRYIPSAFSTIKTLMRDHRTNQRFPIDPRLMDILFVLQHRMHNFKPYDVFSGYRSEQTNAHLRQVTRGVARQSLHMQGQAVDLRLPGTSLSALRKGAIQLRSGGVGFYPSSDFVHIDTGRVRSWS